MRRINKVFAKNLWKKFGKKRDFNSLIEADKTGKIILNAGRYWPNFDFDYEKGLDELIKRDKKGFLIYRAGIYWPHFDYEKGLDALIKIDKDGLWIFNAGESWREFNYEKGFDALIKINKDGSVVFHAGIYWEQFDHIKAILLTSEEIAIVILKKSMFHADLSRDFIWTKKFFKKFEPSQFSRLEKCFPEFCLFLFSLLKTKYRKFDKN